MTTTLMDVCMTAGRAGVRLTDEEAVLLVEAVADFRVEEEVAAGRLPGAVSVRTLWPACSCCGPERDVMVGESVLCSYY